MLKRTHCIFQNVKYVYFFSAWEKRKTIPWGNSVLCNLKSLRLEGRKGEGKGKGERKGKAKEKGNGKGKAKGKGNEKG